MLDWFDLLKKDIPAQKYLGKPNYYKKARHINFPSKELTKVIVGGFDKFFRDTICCYNIVIIIMPFDAKTFV